MTGPASSKWPTTGPGVEPRWTSSAKSGVGTALDGRSLVWFTISHGILDEVYYPRVDQANTRDCGLIVTAPGYFSEEKRDASSVLHLIAPGVPAYRLVNRCVHGRYEIEKTIITDPERDVVMQRIRFRALTGRVEDYRVFVLLAPHIGNQGYGNDGWATRYKGVPMLFAQRQEVALALACDAGWSAMSCGYVGVNDGWRQVRADGYLTEPAREARDGNIALTGEVNLSASKRGSDDVAEFIVVLAFGRGAGEAAQRARMSLASSFERVQASYVREWSRFHEHTVGPRASAGAATPEEWRQSAARDVAAHAEESTYVHTQRARRTRNERRRTTPMVLPESVVDLYRTSSAILAIHEDKRAAGAIIASLSIPWGNTKGDHELGGYHLVWPRDLVNSAGALIAMGHSVLARRTLRYLMSTQEEDGRWAQNLWLDGTPYWSGIQMDEVAFPILFAEMLRREGKLEDLDPYPMIRAAAGFLLRHGPVTGQDRWEENGGYSTFTLAVEVAGMLVAADFADHAGDAALGTLFRETADAWNARIEEWTYVRDTSLAHEVGVDGYYVRIAPDDVCDASPRSGLCIPVKNHLPGSDWARYDEIVSPDALALVRFGLRDPNDPRVMNTVKVIDATLRVRTATGPAWYRYNRDGYGEKENGAPFDGTGVGRPWPLLAGERAHYELAAGRTAAAMHLLGVMRAQASDGGMLPEQVWDGDDLPARELFNGRPTGGAMPLVWAHAEYAKLVRSLHDGRVFDMPQQPYERYVRDRVGCDRTLWAPHSRTRQMPVGNTLRVQSPANATLRWCADDGAAVEVPCRDSSLGAWYADAATERLPAGARVTFVLMPADGGPWSELQEIVVIA